MVLDEIVSSVFNSRVESSSRVIAEAIATGVVDVGELTISSRLLVDRAQAIPEKSSTVSLLILGILGACSTFKHI